MKNCLLEMRGKLSFLVAVTVLAAIFTGCGSEGKTYSQSAAKQHILGWLEAKYPEAFSVTKIEKRTYGEGASARGNYYYYEATSKDTGVSFDGTTSYSYESDSKDDYTVSDKYEEALYGDTLIGEISSISNGLDKYGTLEFDILASDARYKRSRSYDYNTFKSDTDKVHISINLYLDADKSDAMLKELYTFTNRVYSINNDITLTIYKGTEDPMLSLRTKNAQEFSYEYFIQNLS